MEVKIVDVLTLEEIDAIISPVTTTDLDAIKEYSSKWIEFITDEHLRHYSVFKLSRTDSDVVMGLICLVDEVVVSMAVEIRKIEVDPANIGSNKRYDKIAGCLIAFACKYSINKGLKGQVVLIPITKLRNHYISKYQMTSFLGFLKIDSNNARRMIREYFSS